MTSLLEASFENAKGLFDRDRFKIPMYQREYAWTKDEYSLLWSDLDTALSNENYFLGLVILTRDGAEYEVVDGQQRILSLSLLATAVRDTARQYRRESLAQELESTFLFALDYDTDERDAKVQFSDAEDGRVFRGIVTGSLDLESVKTHPMAAAYTYFLDALTKSLGESAFKKLGAWARFLQHDVSFATFVHPNSASAYTVFEVINDRGRELTPADLLKNNLLSVTAPDERDGVYERWKNVASKFDDSRSAFVQYVRHVAMVKRGYILPKELYRRVTRGTDTTTEMPALLAELEEHLAFYLQIRNPEIGGPATDLASRVFAGFQALGVTAVRPLLLALGHQAEQEFVEVLQMTVKIAGVGTIGAVNLEQRFSEAAVEAQSGGDWRAKLQPSVPDKDEFEARLPRQKLRRPALQLLLRSVNQQSMTPEPSGHVHLIRPEIADKGWEKFDEDEFAIVGMTLGNAALGVAARRPRDTTTWQSVQREILPDLYDERQHLDLLSGARWTPSEVRLRGAALATEVTSVWF